MNYGKSKGYECLDFKLSYCDQEDLLRYKRQIDTEEKAYHLHFVLRYKWVNIFFLWTDVKSHYVMTRLSEKIVIWSGSLSNKRFRMDESFRHSTAISNGATLAKKSTRGYPILHNDHYAEV